MEEEMRKEEKHEFPEGGYGWVIVSVVAFSNMLIIPILQGFGLLFRKVFIELDFTATDISIIINVNSAFGMILGLWNGPLLKKYGYRAIAVASCFMTFVGLVLTSQANSFTQFILFYGILPSYGFFAMMAASSLALNSYFRKRRSFASGICMTLTGLGPIIMPLVISSLLNIYTVRGTALIIAGLTLNTSVVCMLLHPASWHVKKTVDEEAQVPLKGDEEKEEENESEKYGSQVDLENQETLVQSTPDLETMILPRRVSEAHVLRQGMVVSEPCLEDDQAEMLEPDSTWWKRSATSIAKSSNDLRGSIDNGVLRSRHCSMSKSAADIDRISEENNNDSEDIEAEKKCCSKIVELFDLDLLVDPIYFNIWLGMSIAFTAEINFSLMLAIILGDRGFDIAQTAKLLSILATTDIIFRFISPFFGKLLKLTARKMYMISLFLLVGSRTCLIYSETYMQTAIVCSLMGCAKGFRTVYMSLVIPNHVPLEKLPSASSLQTVLNGILISICGPCLGYVRDVSGSYNLCIFIMNSFTSTTIILWSIEFAVTAWRKRSNAKKTELSSDPTVNNVAS